MELNGKEVNPRSFRIEDVKTDDYPDFCDAFFGYGEFEDGTALTDAELEQFNEENGDFINEAAFDSLH